MFVKKNLLKMTNKFFSVSQKNPFKILGVEIHASEIQIKKAFGKLAKKYHPDHNSSEKQKFNEIINAYEILSNPIKKKKIRKAIQKRFKLSKRKSVFQNEFKNRRRFRN